MNDVAAELTTALRERLRLIADENSRQNPGEHMARLQKISEQIDQLSAELPQPIEPQLAHFLQRKSYSKALEFLESDPAKN